MEEEVNINQDEKDILEFQEWLSNNNWIFNEGLNKFVNEEKSELKTGLQLTDVFNKEKEEIKIKTEKAKEVADAFQIFLNINGWKITDTTDEFVNRKGDKKMVLELVEDFKIEVAKAKGKKEEIVKEEKAESGKIKQYSLEEGNKKLHSHKYKGSVIRSDFNPKNGTFLKTVKLLDKDDKIQEEFCFRDNYEVR